MARVTELIDLPNAHHAEALWLVIRTEARSTLERRQKRVGSHSICRTHAPNSFDADSEESLSLELVAPDLFRGQVRTWPEALGHNIGTLRPSTPDKERLTGRTMWHFSRRLANAANAAFVRRVQCVRLTHHSVAVVSLE
jgi:hypothetical protein